MCFNFRLIRVNLRHAYLTQSVFKVVLQEPTQTKIRQHILDITSIKNTFAQSVFKVVLQKSILTQIRRLIIYITNIQNTLTDLCEN